MISGIGWGSELIEAAGGVDMFADRAGRKSAKERIVTAEEIIARAPTSLLVRGAARNFAQRK